MRRPRALYSHALHSLNPLLQLKIMRREVGDLMKAGKHDSARIRVEAVLREEALLKVGEGMVVGWWGAAVRAATARPRRSRPPCFLSPLSQSFDLLELYLELLGVRAPLLEKSETAPPDMGEALSSLCYASARVGGDLPELVAIRAQLAKKYGTEFVGEAADDATMAKW